MTQPRRHEARTALGADDMVVGRVRVPPAPSQTSASDTVTLPSGTVIKFRRLNGLDSALLEQQMEQAGFTGLTGPGRATYIRCLALYATETINGALQTPPQDAAALRMRLASLADSDWDALMAAYLRWTGGVPADATFPAGDGAAAP